MENCVFCKIINGDIPSQKVYEDDMVYAFRDINPEAPTHILVIPKSHIRNINEIDKGNSHIVAHIFEVINKLTVEEGLDKDGYRVVSNCGKFGGQTVDHIHFHVLGGRNLSWPPG